MLLTDSVRDWFNRSIGSWMDSRNPPASGHRLHLKNLYIYPSKLGWAFLFLAFVIWLLGTNYQNNLILGLAYFQVSLFTVCILQTYLNLSGLQVTFLSAQNVSRGESSTVNLAIKCERRGANHVTLFFSPDKVNTFEFSGMDEHHESLPHPTSVRGLQRLKRLRLESSYPMGLIKCGSWLRLDADFLVYPTPVACPLPEAHLATDQEDGDYKISAEPQEFYGFRSYSSGDPLRSVAWKQWARDRGLMTITYAQARSRVTELSWESFYRGDKELALSHLCYWVKRLHVAGEPFTISLNGVNESVTSDEGYYAVLRALALA